MKFVRKAALRIGEAVSVAVKAIFFAAALCLAGQAASQTAAVSFYYPVAVGGPVARIIDSLVADFEKAHPTIKVTPIYSGTYKESIVKALTAHKNGTPPTAAVLFAADIYTLIDAEAVVPFDDLAADAEDKSWLQGFYPAFMANSRAAGKTWGIPFQRSTILLYWNKDLFRKAGLDPERPPADWAEMTAYAKRLTERDERGEVVRWGIQIPSSGFPYWLFQGFVAANGAELMNELGTRTWFDRPEAIEALNYWLDLSASHKAHPPGIVEWGATPGDFMAQKAAMIWTTSGNLVNIKKNVPFGLGVSMLPAGKRRGSPTGGGNYYIFRKSPPEAQRAAFKFIKWLTSPERAAYWGINTGYIAVRPDAWRTPAMTDYVAGFPDATQARNQLDHAVAEFSTHENQRVTKALNKAIAAALTGSRTPEQALRNAQSEAERILRPYQR